MPAWEPKIGAGNSTIPTIFSTAKNPRRSVYARRPLMRQGLMQFDVDPEVVSITAFPFLTEHWSTTSQGEAPFYSKTVLRSGLKAYFEGAYCKTRLIGWEGSWDKGTLNPIFRRTIRAVGPSMLIENGLLQ